MYWIRHESARGIGRLLSNQSNEPSAHPTALTTSDCIVLPKDPLPRGKAKLALFLLRYFGREIGVAKMFCRFECVMSCDAASFFLIITSGMVAGSNFSK